MIKSEAQIEKDVYDLLVDYLKTIITGNVYKSGCRPVDAVTEDAVISVSNASADQIQVGHVYVNIYVPDVDNGNGYVPDKVRITELSAVHEDLCDYMTSVSNDEYLFTPGRAAQSIEEPDIRQHFVSMDIRFERITL